MRKLLLLTLVMTMMSAYARHISPQEAQQAASEFLNAKSPATRGVSTPLSLTRAAGNNDLQPFYVFNSDADQGFVIISADDRFSKVLGYSDRGSFNFDKMPPQLKYLLDKFTERANSGTSLGNATHQSWTSSSFSTRADEGVLLETAEWGQDAPFNAETPMFGDQHAPTGCVATAMAIVMKYHNWPETYNWDAMPMKIEYDGENPPAANPELARLMKDAGEAVYMSYGPDESGANMFRAGPVMRYTFDYNPECQYIEAERFQKDFWKNIILENLNKGYPVIYGGFGSGGHAFVFDGYNNDGLHVNWGWDGWDNGYYNIDALNPGGADFNERQSMILNIVPNKKHVKYSQCYTDFGYEWSKFGNEEAMNISVENVKTGEPFHLVHSYGVTAKAGFDGVVGFAIVDKDNNIKEILDTTPISTYHSSGDTNQGLEFNNLVAASEIAPTDKIQIVSKDKTDTDFKIVYGTLEVPSSINVINNSPRITEVTFEIGDGLNFRSSHHNSPLPVGISKLNILNGANLAINWEIENKKDDKTVGVFITSPADTIVFAAQSYGIGVDKYKNANIKAKVLTLKEESINLTTSGSLRNKVLLEDAPSIKTLSLTGEMDATDFWYIRDCFKSLESLDLKTVKIVECNAVDKGNYIDKHIADELPVTSLWAANSITHLILPESLIGIGENALGGVFVKTLSIPKGVKYIEKSNFGDIKAIEVLNPEPPTLDPIAFLNATAPEKAILYVPEGSAKKYKEAFIWKDFKTIEEGRMPENLFATVIRDGIKYECGINDATVIGFKGEPVDITIPNNVNIDNQSYKITGIKEAAFYDCQSLESVVIENEVEEISERAFYSCNNLKRVSLGKGINIQPNAFCYLFGLQSVMFCGNQKMQANIFTDCPQLQNIVIDSDNEVVNLNGIFTTPKEKINIFTSSKEKNFEYNGNYTLYVAGGVTDGYEDDEAEEVQEMWDYGIDREEKVLTITPQVDGLAIEKVLVNGKEAENIYSSRAETTPAFVCAVDDLNNLNVTVEYTLFGSQKMSCEYNSEFNAELPHTQSGIGQITIDSSVAADVYTIDGLLVRKTAAGDALNDLRPGVYVIRQGNKTRKVVVK